MFALKNTIFIPDEAVRREFRSLYGKLNRLWLTEHNADGTHVTAPVTTASAIGIPVGTIMPYAGSSTPSGFLLCNGAAVSRSTYKALFDVIGTTYGTGDGSTTFNVPDLRQRFPLGLAASGTGSTLGGNGGTIDHVHTGPSHQHSISSDGAHTHTGPAHTHSISSDGAHTHTGPSHQHSITAAANHSHTISADGTGNTGTPSATTIVQSGTGVTVASLDHTHTGPSHNHGGATGSDGAHDHGALTGAAGTGATSSDGAHSHGGATGSEGTGATSSNGAHDHGALTGAAGAGSTGTANPPFLAINYIILYS